MKTKIKDHYETVIVGAGPAGLAAAKVLAEAGKEVVIFERNKQIGPKVCAGGLTYKDLEIGVPKKIIAREFKSILLHSQHGTKKIDIGRPLVYTVDREDLGKWQSKILKTLKIPVFTSTNVVEVDKNYIVLEKGKKVKYDYLIGADGATSLVRRFLNIRSQNLLIAIQYLVPKKFKDLELFYNAEKYGITYLWIFPHKKFTSIGTGVDSVWGKIKTTDLKAKLDDYLKEKGIDRKKCLFQSCPINYDYRGFDFGKIFLTGCAGGFSSGLTGEGIYNAIVTGEEVARKIINPEYNTPKIDEILKYKERQEKLLRGVEKIDNITDFLADTFLPLVEKRFTINFVNDALHVI